MPNKRPECTLDEARKLNRIVACGKKLPQADMNYQMYCENFMRPYVRITTKGKYADVLLLCKCLDDISLDAKARFLLEILFRDFGYVLPPEHTIEVDVRKLLKENAEDFARQVFEIAFGLIERRIHSEGKIVSLMARVEKISDGKPIVWNSPYGAGATFPIKGQKDVTCVVTLENGSRYMRKFKCTNEPPSIESVQKDFLIHRGFYSKVYPTSE